MRGSDLVAALFVSVRERGMHVAKKWVGSLIPCAQSLQVEEPTSSSCTSSPEAGSIRLEPMAAKNETYSEVVPGCEV